MTWFSTPYGISFSYTISFISPYINPNNFPINFKIIDSSAFRNRVKRFLFRLIMDPEFFRQVSKSDEIKNFKKSKEYKDAEILFNLSNEKKDLDDFNSGLVSFLDMGSSLFQFFPFDKQYKSDIEWSLRKYKSFIRASSLRKISVGYSFCYYEVLGDLLAEHFFILKRDLKPLIISNSLKFQFPYVSSDYLNQLLKSYLESQYKFVNIIELNLTGVGFYPIPVIGDLYNIFGVSKRVVLDKKIFLRPFFPHLAWTPIILDKSDDLLVTFYESKQYGLYYVLIYVVIYSNEYPLENNKIEMMRNKLQHVISREVVIEIKNLFPESNSAKEVLYV
jgi:hypothetical protein